VGGGGSRAIISEVDDRRYCEMYPTGPIGGRFVWGQPARANAQCDFHHVAFGVAFWTTLLFHVAAAIVDQIQTHRSRTRTPGHSPWPALLTRGKQGHRRPCRLGGALVLAPSPANDSVGDRQPDPRHDSARSGLYGAPLIEFDLIVLR